jgi:3-isopropylmalate dehydrogenase
MAPQADGQRPPYDIAVLKGDGVGPDVVDEALRVLGAVADGGGVSFSFSEYPSGADCYLEQGTPLPDDTLAACRRADAVLIGAMGDPEVRWPDGTEMRPQVDLRFKLDLYAGVRPIYLYASHHTPLQGLEAGDIDLVILRENVEGLFASMDSGIELRGEVATDTMVITRSGTLRLADFAFRLAGERHEARQSSVDEGAGGAAGNPAGPRVTCVDKANIFRSMAFFRRVFDEVADGYPEVARDHAYVDAMALYLVQRPREYDVLVMENMFGDILSDLAAGLVGGMGMAPSGDIGEDAAVFQPSHGTAPDIAGKGIANPVGTILSAAMMLRWLGQRHDDDRAADTGVRIDRAVRSVLAEPGTGTPDLGGEMTTEQLGSRIAEEVAAGRE